MREFFKLPYSLIVYRTKDPYRFKTFAGPFVWNFRIFRLLSQLTFFIAAGQLREAVCHASSRIFSAYAPNVTFYATWVAVLIDVVVV